MDAYELINYLNQVLNLGDSLDETGSAGVYALTKGEHTTKDVTRLELGRFLLYIASGNGVLTDGEVSLVNIVMNQELNAFQYKQLENQLEAPNPASLLSLAGFLSGDLALNQANGTKSTQCTDLLIQAFETFGNLMVAFDENSVSKIRCVKFISGMKSYVMKNL